MTKSIWRQTSVPIKDLNLWDENARFPEEYFNKSEKHLVDYFLKKKDFKIESFAKEIVDEFDLPQLEKIVVYEYKNKNIILEGNRRRKKSPPTQNRRSLRVQCTYGYSHN
jgi:hypothetical protein